MELWKVVSVMLACVLCICIISGFLGASFREARLYAKSGVVTDLDFVSDLVTFRDTAGHEWRFEGVEFWRLGDQLAAVMDGRGTPIIADDRIVSVHFEANAN